MSGKPLPIEQIAKLAADIREINNFAENHGFDTSFVQATVSPGLPDAGKSWDWPLISLGGFSVLLIGLLSVLAFYEPISPKAANFLLVVGMLFVVGSSAAAHKKFDNYTITAIVCSGMIVVLLVGAGVFTPREAADRLQEMQK